MKLVYAVFESGVLPDIQRVMEELEITQYTHWSDVKGAGERNVHEGTPVWPGFNEVLLLVIPEEKVQPLIDRCHAVRDTFPLKPGMKFIVTDCEMY